MNERENRRAVGFAIIAVSVFAGYQFGLQLMGMLGSFLMIVLLAWLVSIAMEPPVDWFERRGYRRGLGAGIVLLAIVLGTVAFIGTFGGMMFAQLSDAVASAPTAISQIITWLNSTFEQNIDPNEVLKSLKLDSTSLTPIISEIAGGALGIAGTLLSVTFELVTVLVFAFYFSADAHRVKRAIAGWLAPDRQRVFVTVWEIAVSKAGGFVVSRVVLAAISAAAHILFFWAVGIPYWLPMGIFAGITAQFIPTVGTYIGIAAPALFALTDEPLDALWVIAFATVYQQIENYVLSPRVSRATMDMHPAVALGAVLVGHAIFGPIGAIIGIPIVAALLAVAETYGKRHELIEDLEEPTPEAAAD